MLTIDKDKSFTLMVLPAMALPVAIEPWPHTKTANLKTPF
jgi:hypothetical protein